MALTTDNMAPQLTKRMVETILAMPIDPSSGMGWSVATEFSRVNDVFHVLRIGPYAYLRDWTLSRIWRDFWPLIAAALALLAGFVFHSVSVERLAQSRARELNDAYVRQREIEDKALKTEERLAALSRLGVVSQLSSIFAHEMGQPLSAIRYRARALKTLLAAPTPRRDLMNDCLKTIDAQSAKAARILQKVRAYAKGETSREAPVRLDLLVETAAADLRRSGRLTVPTRVKTVEVEIPGDELELGLAVLNILKNAAEAAAGGINGEDGASVRVNLSANGRCARLQVVNTGRRLAPGELERHMAPMSSEKKEGIGLGIVIIQSIAEAHGGSFSLRALEAGGAEAVLELPLKFEGEAADREIQETCDVKNRCRAVWCRIRSTIKRSQKMKSMKPQEPLIRVVDDEEEVRDSLKFMLECEGWLVSAYASGFDLLKDFDRSRPGCILLDVRMPDLSGPELQEKLNLMGSRVPIVFITSYSDIHAAIATLKAGADDFLLKPVDPEKLLEVVARTVERSQLLAAGAVLPENLAASAASLTERPRRVLDLMMDGMNDAAIAERLNLSERTVQVYRAQIYKAYGVHSVKQFALLIPRLKAALSSADADS